MTRYASRRTQEPTEKIDSNNIATVFRKGNAITKLLTDAIQKENAGKTGVYYWKKTEARDLFESAGVQFPGGSMQDGLIHSILKNDSPVNRKFVEQTETNVGLQYILDKHKKGKRDRVSYAKVELLHNNFTNGDHIPHEQEYNTRHGVSAIADEVCREIRR